MARVPIALELYSVREDLKRDPAGTLKRVKKMGYEGVEFAGFPLPAKELKTILSDLGLVACSSHTQLDSLLPAKINETIDFNRTIGNPSLICPGLAAEYTATKAGWLRAAELFNGIAATLKPHKMFTGYHNHHIEFTPVEGELPWDLFFKNTTKDVVTQLDTGNALNGGGEAVPLLKKYPGRARSIHLKPYSVKAAAAGGGYQAGFRPLIGQDEVPWADVFKVCETVGATEWYIVEYESDAYPPLDAVERCLKALKAMGK